MSIEGVLTSLLLVWNLAVFATYGWDKYCAQRGYWRLSETFLLVESVCLGGLGALIGAKLFHHKTRKWYFQLAWWLGLMFWGMSVYMIWFGGLL